jgi:S1-C subfamily serine protease
MRSRGFLAGLLGGAVGAALVVLVIALIFDLGEAGQTTVAETRPGPAATHAPAATEGLTPAQIYEQLASGVVMVLAEFSGAGADQFGQSQSAQALGTGFVVEKNGYVLTNAHVVDESGRQATEITVVFNRGGSETQRVHGRLVGVDQGSDVALIKVDPSGLDLRPLPLGDSDEVVVGEPVVAIGNPLGYDFSITSGIVSATGRTLQAPNGMRIPNGIQTDAAINQGNSGGPLINGAGQVIGINEQIASQNGGNDGLGFAVPINTAVRVMRQLRKTGEVEYAWLGVAGQTLTSDVAAMFDLKAPHGGALVEQVTPDSPAAKSGLKGGDRSVTVQGQQYVIGGDIIVEINGVEITSFDKLIAYLSGKKPGDEIALTAVRGSETIKVRTRLAARPGDL